MIPWGSKVPSHTQAIKLPLSKELHLNQNCWSSLLSCTKWEKVPMRQILQQNNHSDNNIGGWNKIVCAQGQEPLLSGCRQDHFSGYQLLINLFWKSYCRLYCRILKSRGYRAWKPWAWIRNSLSYDFSVSLQVHILITVAYILTQLLWALSILTLWLPACYICLGFGDFPVHSG